MLSDILAVKYSQRPLHSWSIFRIPDSSLILELSRGKAIDPVALRSLLNVASAFVAEQLAEHGTEAFCRLLPFQYSLGEGIELTIRFSIEPWTWGQLSTLLRGLRLYLVDGNRPRSYDFEVHDTETLDIYTRIGWGDIGKPRSRQSLGSPLIAVAPSTPSGSMPRRDVSILSSGPLSSRAFFRIPHSDLILELEPKTEIDPERIKAILLTADSFVARKISIFGESGPATAIFDYSTGEAPYARLLVYSAPDTLMTWGQIKTVVDGLWQFVVEMKNPLYTYCQIYDSLVTQVARIGWASILEMGSSPGIPFAGVSPSNSTAKRALQLLPATIQPVSNVSEPLSVYV